MTTDSLNHTTTNNNKRWECQFCKNSYSLAYPYKSHLKRCLVHSKDNDIKNKCLGNLVNELKVELHKEFHEQLLIMLEDMRHDIVENYKSKYRFP